MVGLISIQSQYFSTPSQFVPDTVTGPQLFYKKLSYWPLVWIGDAIKKNTSYIIADGTLIPTAPYGAVYFYTADYSHQSLALINRTNQTLTLDVSGLSHLLATPVTVNRLQQDWAVQSLPDKPISPTVQTVTVTNTFTLNPFEIIYLTCEKKPSDFTNDGTVDMSDFTFLVKNFGKPYTIYDYNLFVENFGK